MEQNETNITEEPKVKKDVFGLFFLLFAIFLSLIETGVIFYFKIRYMAVWDIAVYAPFAVSGIITFSIKLLLQWSWHSTDTSKKEKSQFFKRVSTLSLFSVIATAVSILFAILFFLFLIRSIIDFFYLYENYLDIDISFPLWLFPILVAMQVLIWLACAKLLKLSGATDVIALKLLMFFISAILLIASFFAPAIVFIQINNYINENKQESTLDYNYPEAVVVESEDDEHNENEENIENTYDIEDETTYSDAYVESIQNDILSCLNDTIDEWRENSSFYTNRNTDSCRFLIDLGNYSFVKYIVRHDELEEKLDNGVTDEYINPIRLEKYTKLAEFWNIIKYGSESELEQIIDRMRPFLKSNIGRKTYISSGLYLYVNALDFSYKDLMSQYENGNTTIFNELYDYMAYYDKYNKGMPYMQDMGQFMQKDSSEGNIATVWAYSFWARRYNENGRANRLQVLRKYLDEILAIYPNTDYVY